MASILALLLSIDAATAGSSDMQLATTEPTSQSRPITPIHRQPEIAMVCFYDSQETSGMNKICYYNCLGSLAAITLGFADICPMSIDR
jgi:hypothetical protein